LGGLSFGPGCGNFVFFLGKHFFSYGGPFFPGLKM